MERYLGLLEKSRRYVWNPFTQMKDFFDQEPVIVERGEGVWLEDVRGRRYYDGVSSLWLNVHGHRVPELDRAIADQLGKIAHCTMLGQLNVPAVELAERLIEISPPGLNKVFYSDSGAEAVEIAIKMAYQFWQHMGHPEKRKFITMTGAYHGDTLGAVSVGAIDLYHRAYGALLFETVRVPYPYCYRCPLNQEPKTCGFACLHLLHQALEAHGGETAALIVEPEMQGAGGMIAMPDGFLREVRDLCTRWDVLMIADEVAVGFGRTGKMFACEHTGVSPDFLTCGKGLTGGYLPVAATLTTDRVYEAFLGEPWEEKTFYHGHSYTGNPLGCAAALANLDLFDETQLVDRAQKNEAYLRKRLQKLIDHPHVGDIRIKGMMVGIELVADRATKEPFPARRLMGAAVCRKARDEGMIIRPLGDVVVFMPPLATPEGDLEAMTDILIRAVEEGAVS
ncbi:adenosylmethionine--8-amino-7-oxononanoate transaminase [Kyrpidia spormannii]|uniref:Adenosylmethionine-8-amino-7-oxononanoate aminotransferase n=1 Tax=Kyrpidia spormannii TaxID=2055160 RepID=A0A2K8N8R1_9BACL|nr:adenosylmethionine--8-amino-7-oxononanoate transaminase [Kyrpidia spormannii]ATY85714.1 adenosylmethionine--8-amino-7-oxononanoate transaminase [Kyrpidia spormannii]